MTFFKNDSRPRRVHKQVNGAHFEPMLTTLAHLATSKRRLYTGGYLRAVVRSQVELGRGV